MSNGSPQFDSPQSLAAAVKAKYPVYQSMPDDQLASAVLKKYPTYWKNVNAANFAKAGMWQPSITETKTEGGIQAKETALGKGIRKVGETVAGTLPTAGMVAGGMAGAVAGGPTIAGVPLAGAAGAGAGAAAGEALREKVTGQPISGKEVGKQAAMGAGMEFGGGLAMKGVEKGLAALAPKAEETANKLILRLISPTAKQAASVAGARTKVQGASEIASEVNKVAGNARSLASLYEKVTGAIDSLTQDTRNILQKYDTEWHEIPVSKTESQVPRLTTGAPQLGAGKELAKPGVVGEAASEGTATAKGYVQKGIQLNSILRSRGYKAVRELSETQVPDKTKTVTRLLQMIRDHAGKGVLNPTEALDLRQWMRRDMQWPAGTKGLRDDIYHQLNREIEQYLTPEDAAAFRKNNASVHRLLKAADATDNAAFRKLKTDSHWKHYWGLRIGGAAVGGGIGAMAGGEKGMYEGLAAGAALGEAGAIAKGLADTERGTLMSAAASRGVAKGARTVLPIVEKTGKVLFGNQ